jgi:SNF2 family DNA or RNA helicase
LYFGRHWSAVEPFVPPTTSHHKQMIEKMKQVSIENEKESKELTQPTYITGTMRDYQLKGLKWLIDLYDQNVSGCILGDGKKFQNFQFQEMGLGKTIQSISFLSMVKNERKTGGISIVIAPLSVLSEWKNEFEKWSPDIKVLKYHGNDYERTVQREKIKKDSVDVILTNYERFNAG